jgi:outer membrane protein assembly factor BamD (BamD/ComL family)
MHHTNLTVNLVFALLFGVTACSPVAKVSSTGADEVLFERAMDAVHRNRFDVGHLMLETLVNTYPDSPYASKAHTALQDPRVANCGDSWTTSPGCDSIPEAVGPD